MSKLSTDLPERMVSDSKLLCVLKESDDDFLNNMDKRIQLAVNTVLPLYEGVCDFDDNSLIDLVEELNYLDCSRLDEVLVMLHFRDWNATTLAKINEDVRIKMESMNIESTEKLTYISLGMLDALKCRYRDYEFDNQDFKLACTNGHLEVAQWMYSLGCVDIHAGDDIAFRCACSRGHPRVAQWLLSIGGVNIHANEDCAFRCACFHGHLEVAQWLHNLGGVNIHSNDDYAFLYACGRGHLKVAQWLHSLGGVNIHACYNFAFQVAKHEGHMEVFQWLKGLMHE